MSHGTITYSIDRSDEDIRRERIKGCMLDIRFDGIVSIFGNGRVWAVNDIPPGLVKSIILMYDEI